MIIFHYFVLENVFNLLVSVQFGMIPDNGCSLTACKKFNAIIDEGCTSLVGTLGQRHTLLGDMDLTPQLAGVALYQQRTNGPNATHDSQAPNLS